MTEQAYPTPCKSCGKSLYGPVKYCPYCTAQPEVAPSAIVAAAPLVKPVMEVTPIKDETKADIATPSSEKVSAQEPPINQDKPQPESPPEEIKKTAPETKSPEKMSSSVSETKTGKPNAEVAQKEVTHPKNSNAKWIAVAVVSVIFIVSYVVSHKKGGTSQEPSGSQQSASPATPGKGNKESARIAAQDALRQGTGLSLTISKLPKLDKVLKAAKELGDISPRYKDQVTSAESTVSTARTERDNNLMAYLGKVVEMGRYSPDQVSYAMGVIKGGDISPREKSVIELIANHVDSVRNSSKPDPKKLLSDFNKQFNDFVD